MSKKCPKCQTNNPEVSKYCRECAEPLLENQNFTQTFQAVWKGLSIGSIFAEKYQIIEELGKGGMGKVYRALDREIEEYVAIKIIRPEIAADKTIIQRFRNELKIARKISHKNVCRMFDLNKEGETYYITMEYVHGEDLKSSIRRMGQLSLGKALFIVKQVCDGLSEAHRLGIIHRDLKPQNIMIDGDGNVRIMDFGIARSHETSGLTDSGGVVGTAEYMSPEQVDGISVDLRSDIYSLGIILYELVTGSTPFDGTTPMSVALKRMLQSPAEPSKINGQIPEGLSKVIMTCLNKDREKRYESTDGLLLDLKEIESHLPSTDKVIPKSKSYTTKEITVSFKPKKILIIAASISIVAAAGILIWLLVLKPNELRQAVPVLLKSDTATTEAIIQEPESKPAEKTPEEKPQEMISQSTTSQTSEQKIVQKKIATPPIKTEVKPQSKEQQISSHLQQVQAAFDKGDFQASIDLSRKILLLDPENAEAVNVTELAEQELAKVYIVDLIGQFNSAVNKKTLPEFYLQTCTAEFYEKIKKDADLIIKSYESLKSVTSDNSLQFIGPSHLLASFPNITMGVLKQGGKQEVLFEGNYTWEMKKIENTWKIISIKTNTIKRSIKKEKI